MHGFDIDVTPLYPKINLPVSTETPPLSHLVEWAYFEKMKTCSFIDLKGRKLAVYKPVIFTHDEDYEYLTGNVVDGIRLFPFAGALVLVWDTLAMTSGQQRRHCSVRFQDVTFHTEPHLVDDRALHVTVMVQRGNGRFEVSFEHGLVAEGYVSLQDANINLPDDMTTGNDDALELTNDDIYKLFYERGYQYKNQFRSIQRASMDLSRAQLAWKQNWVTFIDGAIQLNVLKREHKEISQLRHIKHLQIDVNEQARQNDVVDVLLSDVHRVTKCGGLVIKHDIVFRNKSLMSRQSVGLKVLKLGPHQEDINDIWERKALPLQNDRVVALEIAQFGNLNTLEWVESPPITGGGIPVTVHYAGLNGYDAKRATAELSIDNQTSRGFGMDFSGVTDRGVRVMGLVKGGAVCNKVNAHPELLWPVPDHWTMEDAATVPLPYSLAFYALGIKNKLFPDLNVLIHGGAGALGMAAISVCLGFGCNIFTTVSDMRKKKFLLKMFPELKAENIGNSRDGTFVDMVLGATKGEGCSFVIINSTAEKLKQVCFNCCAPCGTVIDILSQCNLDNFEYGMKNLTWDRNYTAVDLSFIFNNGKVQDMKRLQLMVSEGIARGYVRPLPRVRYTAPHAARALRLLAASRHRGRALLDVRNSILPATRTRIPHSTNSSHLIFCDESDLGIHLANRLINNGAKNIYIHRSEPSGYLQYKLISWQRLGVQVKSSYENIKGVESVAKVIKDCKSLAAVEGIYVINVDSTNPKPADKLKTVVMSLEVLSKELGSALRYVAVIREKEFEHELCINKARACLPIVSVRLPNLEKFNNLSSHTQAITDNGVLKMQSAVDCIEQALIAGKPAVLAYVQPERRKTFLEAVAKITGVNFAEAPTEVTLEQIGIDEGKAQEISHVLENFNITIPKEDVLQMTVADLTDIQSELFKTQPQLSGLSIYLNFIDKFELEMTKDIAVKAANTSDMCPVTFDTTFTYLCIVPGIEGHHNKFDTLCERLKLPSLVLQPGLDDVDETIEDIAQRLADVMVRKVEPEKTFYLLGYEFGVLVAVEMAAILEKRGLTGVVYCLGGGPEDMIATFRRDFGNIPPEELKSKIIAHVYTMLSNNSDKLENDLKLLRECEDKVETCVKMLRKHSSLSSDYIRAIINVTYARIKMVCKYVPKHKDLKSKIIILKAESQTGSVDDSQAIVHHIGTPLAFLAEDLKCAAIINKYLDTDVIDENFKKNLCETTHIEVLEKVQFYFTDELSNMNTNANQIWG